MKQNAMKRSYDLSAAPANGVSENGTEALKEKVNGIDMNRRMSSLILTCEEFDQRKQDEDIEMIVAHVLNKRFPDIKLSKADIQVAHRLQGKSKVIVRIVNTRTGGGQILPPTCFSQIT